MSLHNTSIVMLSWHTAVTDFQLKLWRIYAYLCN